MHGLETIVRLNDEATRRCALCRRFAVQLEDGNVIHRVEQYTADDSQPSREVEFCSTCLAEEVELSHHTGVITQEVKG